MWFIALIALLFGGASMPLPGPTGTFPAASPGAPVNKCYQLEPDQKITIAPGSVVDGCKSQLEGKTYVRVRQMVKIVKAKISEGSSNWGTCDTTEPSGYGALRKVGAPPVVYPVARIGDIFWEDLNYTVDNMSDFILVLTDKDAAFYTFDVYIDETKSNDIPGFVQDCKEIGGLVPVPDIAAKAEFPPEAFATTDTAFNAKFGQTFDKSCCETEYADNVLYLDDKYFMKLSEKTAPAIAEQVGVVTMTIDGETRNYDVMYHVGTVYLVGQSGQPDEGGSWIYNASATKPPIEAPFDNESLKLKELKFVYVSPWTWATPECKPAIYLYPEKPMEVGVKVKPRGRITASEPEHGAKGWKVMAYPDGRIKSKVKSRKSKVGEYPYLYYETELDKVRVPESGWIVEKGELGSFFGLLLPRLGLNQAEMKDFMDYWLPKLSTGERWFIGLVARDELDRVEPIEFSRVPDTFIRIRFYFEKLPAGSANPKVRNGNRAAGSADIADIEDFDPAAENQATSLLNQKYPVSQFPPRRLGFTAVDWGGIVEGGSCGVGVESR